MLSCTRQQEIICLTSCLHACVGVLPAIAQDAGKLPLHIAVANKAEIDVVIQLINTDKNAAKVAPFVCCCVCILV